MTSAKPPASNHPSTAFARTSYRTTGHSLTSDNSTIAVQGAARKRICISIGFSARRSCFRGWRIGGCVVRTMMIKNWNEIQLRRAIV
jgi:hypothetical protein